MNWLDSLTEPQRQAVYAAMRDIGDRGQENLERHRRLSPPCGQIAAGAAHMDPFFHANAADEFLRLLRGGSAPEEAYAEACFQSAAAVAAHNLRRPKDVNWSRWVLCQDGNVARMMSTVRVAARATVAVS